jgi:hypothetical protein
MPQPAVFATAPPSILLRLPGEIRNKILQFALTSAAPLHHRQPKATQSKQVASHHHRLIEGRHFEYLADGAHPEFNKIKLVNKQLHSETAGLEVQYNAITFSPQFVLPFRPNTVARHNRYSKSAEQWLFDFVAPMKASKLAWLSMVIIDSKAPCLSVTNPKAPPMPDLPALVSFCKQNPEVEVRYQFANFEFDWTVENPSLIFFTVGLVLTTALKGDEAGETAKEALLSQSTWLQVLYKEARHWREVWNIAYLLKDVNNFTVWPTVQPTGDYFAGYFTITIDAEKLHAGDTRVWDWYRYAKLWVENGISGADR